MLFRHHRLKLSSRKRFPWIFHGFLFFHTVLNLLMSAACGSGGLLTKRQLVLKQKNNDVEDTVPTLCAGNKPDDLRYGKDEHDNP